jgi:hypothetical protein
MLDDQYLMFIYIHIISYYKLFLYFVNLVMSCLGGKTGDHHLEHFYIIKKLWIIIFPPTPFQQLLFCFCNEVYQLLALGQQFSPGTPVSSATQSGYHNVI